MVRKLGVFGLIWVSGCSTASLEVSPCIHGPAGYGADCTTGKGDVKLEEAQLETYECYSPEDGRAIREWIKRRFMVPKK